MDIQPPGTLAQGHRDTVYRAAGGGLCADDAFGGFECGTGLPILRVCNSWELGGMPEVQRRRGAPMMKGKEKQCFGLPTETLLPQEHWTIFKVIIARKVHKEKRDEMYGDTGGMLDLRQVRAKA